MKATHLVHDRDTKFTAASGQLLGTVGIRIVNSPAMAMAPNANAFAGPLITKPRQECLGRFMGFGCLTLAFGTTPKQAPPLRSVWSRFDAVSTLFRKLTRPLELVLLANSLPVIKVTQKLRSVA